VKVDADDFRRVYDSLNDEALLAVKRDELVEVAQQCYDIELARRGLAGPHAAADPAPASAEPASPELVEVATFTDVDDARLARDLLESAEIPSYLATDAKLPGNMSVPGGFRLSVSPSLLEQAREVLDTQVSDEELAAQAEAAGEIEPAEDEAPEDEPPEE
jgi:hypothetical protein